MPDFFAFAGLRYDCGAAGTDLEALAAPPYDVIDEERRAALEAAAPHNAVRLLLPRDEHDRRRSLRAGGRRARRLGAVGRAASTDATPRFYSYRMEFRGPHGDARHTRGVIGALALPEPGDTSVLPHERTAAKAKSDRLALLRATRANVDPIWGLSLAAGLTGRLEPDTDARPLRRRRRRGPRARRDRRPGPHREPSARAIGGTPIVLADGHHRFETACDYRDELPRRRRATVGGAGAIMMLVVELVDDELDIEPIHRLLDLPAGDRPRRPARRRVRRRRRRRRTPPTRSRRSRPAWPPSTALGIVDRGGSRRRDRTTRRCGPRALADEHPAVAATDAAVVEALVVPRLPEATGATGTTPAAVAAQVDKGAAERRDPLQPGVGRADARRRDRPRAHAAEDDVLHAQAALGDGVPPLLNAVGRCRRDASGQADAS